MRLDPLLDAISLLSALWVGASPQGCPASPSPANLALVTSSPELAPPAAMTAFVDVHVIPMDTERVLAHQTVLVAGGRITALGPTDQVPVPAGAARIDGRGKYLMPGLGDMHTHHLFGGITRYLRSRVGGTDHDLRLSLLLSYLAHGVTTIRYLDAVSGDTAQMLRQLQRAEVLGPRIYLAGKVEEFVRPGPDSVAASAAAYKAAGYDFLYHSIPVLTDQFGAPLPGAAETRRRYFDAQMATARRLRLPVGAHAHYRDSQNSFEKMLALGAVGGSYEHIYALLDIETLRGEAVVSMPEAKMRALATATQRAGVWITPTMNCMELKYGKNPSSLHVSRQIVKALQDAGAGLLLGADHAHMPDELAAMVRTGLTPYQALVTGTRNVAQYFGTLDSSGTVAVGKWADLVLFYGNPLENIRHTREVAGVMTAGRWLGRGELDQRLLASPKAWLEFEVGRLGFPRRVSGTAQQMTPLTTKMAALADSLTAKPAPAEYERLVRLFTDELGAMRTILPPGQRERFDPMARVWLREQARQGYQLAIPGVTSGP